MTCGVLWVIFAVAAWRSYVALYRFSLWGEPPWVWETAVPLSLLVIGFLAVPVSIWLGLVE